MAKLAFIGLGVMGFPMAGHLQKAGHDVTVYNRTTAKAEKWVENYGGASALTPAEAAKGADVVFTCVGNDDDLRSVILGDEGALAGMSEGALLVDHTTASALVARELADVAGERGIGFVDAPVSGGQAGAENGQLAVMCGGGDADFARAREVMTAYAKACECFGSVGAGQLTKMVNQVCIAGIVQGISEGLNFAAKSGLDPKAVAKLVAQGAGGSWQLENRANTMADGEFEFGFAVNWMRKDLGIALEHAQHVGVSLPVAALVDQFYGDVQALGGGRWDTSSLIHRLRVLGGDAS
ncbi:NAD(P)-dependent oxidoreductase [Qingshengfaniella alkalisoli]|uniref:NAD(P)-dependent oxidoreductase n=1 Tax=Qingshengfaniella alkalisoli TaxID=2599296 RepID=A0A5B8I6D7_9RHOB|nr:NAD(P)-dependent oxidoreductase [Qingshengfaniella alkalisoli]QDY69055.1 NAD(P)-dependent oxidoreductase [Qingshengfaniella alkalisoli]